jgi:hypothetical protein
MTVVIGVKVFDGLVLAADSATTLGLASGSHQVYNHANKIFHLHRALPVGGVTWGLGQIGNANIATLAKDLRRRLMGDDPGHLDWVLDHGAYTVEAVANRLVEMFYDELYEPIYAGLPSPGTAGFLIAGYSAGSLDSEIWQVLIDGTAARPVPVLEAAGPQTGWLAKAQTDASFRLMRGYDEGLANRLRQIVPALAWPSVEQALAAGERAAVIAPMPFGDAINFAKFLVDVTVGFSRFLLGPDSVGGPVEVAGITRHEGFKWISRKHYYPQDLNPREPHA